MTIEAGALALRISEIGADQVLAKLGAIDAKAKALGGAVQNVKFNVPNATGVSGQLQQIGMGFTQVGNAATAAAPAVDKHTDAQKRSATAGKDLAAQLGQQVLGYYSINQVVSTAIRIFDEFNEAADRQANAQRRLGATAAFTGASLADVKAINAQAQLQFRLSTADSANLTAAFARLAFMSGNVGQTGKLMTAWMDLAAAQGLTLDQVMTGVNSTISGQDEGLNRLGLMDPSGIWKKWADALGTTVGKMTDQQKFQAIINEVTAQGGKVTGEYAKYLETAQGAQQAFNSSLEQFNAHVGEAGFGVRAWAYSIGSTLVTAFVDADKWLDRMAEKTSNWIALFLTGKPRITGVPAKDHVAGLELSQNVDAAALRAQLDAAAGITKPPPKLTAADKAAARERQAIIERALAIDLGNMPLTSGIPDNERAAMMAAMLARTTPTVGVDKSGKMKGVKAFGLADVVDKEFDALAKKLQEKKEFIQGLVTEAGMVVGSAFGDAFTAAFQSGGNFFEAFGKSLLSGLGNIIMQLGEQMIAYAAIITPLTGVLGPFAAIAGGGPMTLAAGIALTALGAAMGAAGSRGSKGGGGGSAGRAGPPAAEAPNEWEVAFDPDRKLRKRQGPAVIPSARSIDSTPMPDARPVVSIGALYALSPDDPRWQRELASTYMAARDRGLIRKTG